VNRLRTTWTLAFAAALVVASCGSSTTASPSAGASAAASPSTAASEAATAAASASAEASASASTAPVPSPTDQPLRVGWLSEPDTMNPLTSETTESVEVTQLIYDKLMDYGLDLKPEFELATSFTQSPDDKAMTFKLRDGVKWQDGQPFTSADVAYTYNLIHDNSLGQYAQFLLNLTGVKTPDPLTIELDFSAPQAFNPALVVPIVPKHIWSTMTVKQLEQYPNDKPVGTGPYALTTKWVKGSPLTVTRNDQWWGQLPSPASITWVRYDNSDVMGQALRSGDLDIIPQVPPTVYDGMTGTDNVKAVALPSFSFHHIGFNVSSTSTSKGNPLLKDLVVRQAIQDSVDRNQLVQLCLAGHGTTGDSIIPAGMSDWHLAIPAEQQFNANPDTAKQILDAAGYTDPNNTGVRSKDGKPLEFRLIAINTTDVDVCAAKLFVDAAATIGVKLDLTTLDENTLSDTVYNKDAPNWDIFVWGWDSGALDPSYMLGVPLCSQIGGNNDVFYCNKSYDAQYAQQAITVDPAARKAITDQMQQEFYNDAAYLVMWYQDKLQAYRTDTWANWQEIPGGIIFNFTRDNYLHIVPAAH